jgi:hypothetical protein
MRHRHRLHSARLLVALRGALDRGTAVQSRHGRHLEAFEATQGKVACRSLHIIGDKDQYRPVSCPHPTPAALPDRHGCCARWQTCALGAV